MAFRCVLALLVLAAMLPSRGAAAAPLDFPVPDGHFFTQAAGQDGKRGFPITNAGGMRFYDEFKRLGGVDALGYPISRRFLWKGFSVQVLQKGALQWRPEVGQAWLVNVFDDLHAAGKDDWLVEKRSTPKPLDPSFDGGRDWDGIIGARLALLDENPAIRARYFEAADPMTFFGLPQSRAADNGNHFAMRFQRAVIQQWKVDVPWAKAGQVTVANGGDVAREAGMFPEGALAFEWAPGTEPVVVLASPVQSAPTARGVQRPAGDPASVALDRLNYYRGLSGLPPVTLHAALLKMAESHVSYYAKNFGDPDLAGMGLHTEKPGRPGFTGQTIAARGDAAGYQGYAVDENMGLAGDPTIVVDAFIDTVNHRWNMMHPSAVEIGYAMAREPGKIDVINIGVSETRPSIALPAHYPGTNQKDVPTQSHIWETPDPAPGLARPTGYPITISFLVVSKVQWGDLSLVDSGGRPVEFATYQKDWLKSLAIIPRKPLKAGETYTVRVKGTVDGAPFDTAWSFTTKA